MIKDLEEREVVSIGVAGVYLQQQFACAAQTAPTRKCYHPVVKPPSC